jgi:diguanylate cyclase
VSYTDDVDQTIAYGQKVLSLLKARNCPASPKHYELWFTYVSGHNRALVKSVNEALKIDGTLTAEASEQIYSEHLSQDHVAEQIDLVGAQMGGEIDQILDTVSHSMGKTSEYSESLADVTQNINEGITENSLKKLVQTLVKSTSNMERSNLELQKKLKESSEQISDLNQNLELVRSESRTDQLTGIANRKHFDEALEEMIRQSERNNTEACLLIGDIDHFKKFNDTFGHQTGDQVLRLVAHAISSNVKGKDLAARYGGEEFAILLPETSLRAAVTVANQIRLAIKSKELVKKSTGENLGVVTFSIGISRFHPNDIADDMISRADTCLYAAKNAGRDQVKCETDPGITFDAAVA